MSEFDKLYKILMLEMARPATILNFNRELNYAYSVGLKIMRKYGETNAGTYTVWDYIWRCIPDSIKTESIIDERKKRSSPDLKFFIIDLIKYKLTQEMLGQLIDDLQNDQKIRLYVNRSLDDRGNRAKGAARQSGLSPWSLDDVSSI